MKKRKTKERERKGEGKEERRGGRVEKMNIKNAKAKIFYSRARKCKSKIPHFFSPRVDSVFFFFL